MNENAVNLRREDDKAPEWTIEVQTRRSYSETALAMERVEQFGRLAIVRREALIRNIFEGCS